MTTSFFEPETNPPSPPDPDWPHFNPTSCTIQGQPTAMPADPQTAAQACSGITDPAQKANCTFDVTVTGNTGFAETYTRTQAFQPHGGGWQPTLAGVGLPGPGTGNGWKDWPWWVWVLIAILILIVPALLFRKSGDAVAAHQLIGGSGRIVNVEAEDQTPCQAGPRPFRPQCSAPLTIG